MVPTPSTSPSPASSSSSSRKKKGERGTGKKKRRRRRTASGVAPAAAAATSSDQPAPLLPLHLSSCHVMPPAAEAALTNGLASSSNSADNGVGGIGEDEMGRMSEREAWLRPCLYCESDHDAGSFFHPMAALLREAAERGKKGREGGGGSKHKLGPGELRCDMCFGAFVCKDPLLLAVHQVRGTFAS